MCLVTTKNTDQFVKCLEKFLNEKFCLHLWKTKLLMSTSPRQFWNCGVSKRCGCGEVLLCKYLIIDICIYLSIDIFFSHFTVRDVMLSFSAPLGLTHTCALGIWTDFCVLGLHLGWWWVSELLPQVFPAMLDGCLRCVFLKLFTVTLTGC